jgi:hypothetical protein
VKQLYTGLVDLEEWSWVLNCTEAHGGFLKLVNKICAAGNLILRCIGFNDKCVAGGTDQTVTLS